LALERAAATYDDAAVLQREVGSRLLERLQFLNLKVEVVCDLGCGTGSATRHLFKKFSGARVVGVDLSQKMLAIARRRAPFLRRLKGVCADVVQLPLRGTSVDLLFSNLLLHGCGDLDGVLAEMARVLKPGGALLFSTFGPDTLREWRAGWDTGMGGGAAATLVDMHDVGDALVRAGFVEPVMDVEHLTLEYHDASRLLDDLRALGERNFSVDRRRTLTGKGRLAVAMERYETFRADGALPATFEVVYGLAWASPQGARARAGQASVPVDTLRQRLRERRKPGNGK
jgi:malonyl-CoA O-methyltransferase